MAEGRALFQYRYLKAGDVLPNYSFEWRLAADGPPAGTEIAIVDQASETLTEIKQSRKTNGHYWPFGLEMDIPASKTRYKDFVIPDYTNGIDFMGAHFTTKGWGSNDEVVAGKLMVGQIGQLAAPAALGATQVLVATTAQGLLKPTLLGGAIDEGFNLSFGVDDVLDSDLNADPVVKPELPEFEIKRVGAEQDAGGGVYLCQMTLFTGLDAAKAAGLPVNLVVPFVKSPFKPGDGGRMGLGLETFVAGNCPPSRRVRFGVKNVNPATALELRAVLAFLY